jgi:uncharacterized protein YndB with AHSA1/START domain
MAVTSSRKAVVTLPSDREIVITREFDAPKHLVYKAYTTPELVKRWWSGDHNGRTTLTTLMQLPNKEIRDAIIETGMEGGMQESFNHLDRVLETLR